MIIEREKKLLVANEGVPQSEGEDTTEYGVRVTNMFNSMTGSMVSVQAPEAEELEKGAEGQAVQET